MIVLATIPKAAGVYLIRNDVNQKGYIGSTRGFYGRVKSHLAQLRKGTHSNSHLQSAWTKYGAQSFSFHVLTVVPSSGASSIYVLEADWIERLHATHPASGYNFVVPTPAGGTPPVKSQKGKKLAPDHYQKIVAINKARRGYKHTTETRARMSASHRGKYPGHMDKTWQVTSPEGQVFIIRNLSAFCREHNLTRGGMSNVVQGKVPNYKGWKCERLDDE